MNSEQDWLQKSTGRKAGLALACMACLTGIQAPPWLIATPGLLAMTYQFLLDAIERIWLKTDLPDNGNGHTEPAAEAKP